MTWTDARWGAREVKFNPNHDPKDGRFTSGPGSGGGGRQKRSGGQPKPDRDGRTWGGQVFSGGGGSSEGGGATGYYMTYEEVQAYQRQHPGTDPYLTQPGDSVASIAAAHGLTADQVHGLTGVRAGAILRPGQIVALPAGSLRKVDRNGYTFRLDAVDRTHEAEGDLHLAVAQERSRSSQRQAGGADRRAADDGGHFISARFGGPSDSFNHFAQDANFNRGRYRAMEDGWARDLRVGKHVSVDIIAHYVGASHRPTELDVIWSTNGRKRSQKFHNERGGRENEN